MRILIFLLCIPFFIGCNGPEPRKPVKVKSGSFYKKSVDRSRQLLAAEEKLIQEVIAHDSLHHYESSSTGSWYYFTKKNENSNAVAETDDLVTMTYNIMTFDNDTIYSNDDIGVIQYKVDKQDLFPGLRNSVKLLKENETATFLFPSSLGYGYQGDNDRIGVNIPIKSTISIFKIEKQQDSLR